MSWLPARDGSRDHRIDDPTNTWFVHLVGRMLLPLALKLRIAANPVSVAGLLLGVGGAFAYLHWPRTELATLGFLLCVAWLIADGLDGMIARATATTSALGRFLDGVCDHVVFVFLYVLLAVSLGTLEGWLLALAAGLAHGVQSTLYEGERIRFHRRVRGEPGRHAPPSTGSILVRAYDGLAGSLDKLAEPFEQALAAAPDRPAFGARYGRAALGPMRLMIPLTNNNRVILIYLACLLGDPRLFFWVELGPLTLIAIAGLWWHRKVEARLVAYQ